MAQKESVDQPIFAPMLRFEGTMRTAPAFRYLDEVVCGESEPCPVEGSPVAEIDALLALESLFSRPRMHVGDARDLRDVLLVAQGASFALAKPGAHAFDGACEFTDYVNSRFGQSPRAHWATVLLDRLGSLPFIEACEAAAQVVRDWRNAKTNKEN